MKVATLSLAAAIVLGGVGARAQSSYAVVTPPDPSLPAPIPGAEGARWLKFGGISLFVAGGITLGVGLWGWMAADDNGNPHADRQNTSVVLMASGGAIMLGGIPLLVAGVRRAHELETSRAMPTLVPLPRGGALRWAF